MAADHTCQATAASLESDASTAAAAVLLLCFFFFFLTLEHFLLLYCDYRSLPTIAFAPGLFFSFLKHPFHVSEVIFSHYSRPG